MKGQSSENPPVALLSKWAEQGISQAVPAEDAASHVRLAIHPVRHDPCLHGERELTVRPSPPAVALLHQLQRPAAGDHG